MNIQDFLNQIEELTPTLNKATDEAQAVIARLEGRLEVLGVGLSAFVPFPCGCREHEKYNLEYARVGGKYRFAVCGYKVEFDGPISEEYTAWASCSREVKLDSFAVLPQLLEKLAEQIDETVERTTKARKLISNAASEIK